MIYIVRQSGTAGGLFLSCPLGLPGPIMYIVEHSGTARGVSLSCPVGLPEAYDVHCGAQWDCWGLMSELSSRTTGGL